MLIRGCLQNICYSYLYDANSGLAVILQADDGDRPFVCNPACKTQSACSTSGCTNKCCCACQS